MGRNTLEKNWFIAEHFIWGVVIFIWYRSVFCCLENCTLAASRLILVGILAASSIVFGFAEFRSRRNTLNVILNLFFGYGLYSVLAYKHIFTEFIRMTLIPSGAAALLLTGFILLRPIAKKEKKGSVIRLRVRRSIRAVQKSFGMGLSVILLVLVVNNLFGDCLFPSNAETFFRQSTEEETIAGNIEKIALLESSSWAKLTVKERLDLLQTIANVERCRLGLPNELNVGADNLKDEIRGQYNDRTHQIIINMDVILYDDPEDVLKTLLHEAYHSYEHRCAEARLLIDEKYRSLKFFREAAVYGDEFSRYIDYRDDGVGYYYQLVEADARQYASEAVEEYAEAVHRYYVELKARSFGCSPVPDPE